jgi:hypothetical protein
MEIFRHVEKIMFHKFFPFLFSKHSSPLKTSAQKLTLPLKSGVLRVVQNVDKELRNGCKASACGVHAGI